MKNISVIGSGTMGNGIAHTFAQYGYEVSIIDLDPNALESAMTTIGKNLNRQIQKGMIQKSQKSEILSRIHIFEKLGEGVKNADLAIEAATENLDTKLTIFKQLDDLCPGHTILASNTSSISITKIAAVTHQPGRVIGMHFMNPVPVMKLVEVICGYSTSRETQQKIIQVSTSLEKSAVLVNDYPGFVANRILMPMINEAITALHEGVASVENIDQVMKLGMAHPMGPLQLADFIGLDVCLSILKVLQEGFGQSKYAPCPLLVNMVLAGHTGVKSGEGFYDYSSGIKEAPVAHRFR